MKKVYQSILSFIFIQSRLIPFILIFICFGAFKVKGQSLFEMAITLDSLYNNLESDSTAASAFFTELNKLYLLDREIKPANIKIDFAPNRYMNEKVNIAFRELSLRDDQTVDEIAQFEKEKADLLASAIKMAEEACRSKVSRSRDDRSAPRNTQPDPCGFENEIRQLTLQRNIESLTALRKISPDELRTSIINIERRINKIDQAIERKKAESESVFQLSAEAGAGMPFSSTAALASEPLPPIIIQQQGSGSLQSSIIDGTSKWIAERMREELSIAFFDRFEHWVEGENIKILFPNTFSALRSSITTDYALMIQIFKTAFEKDLKYLPFNLSEFLELELAYKDTLAKIDNDILIATTRINEINRQLNKITAEREQLSDELFDLGEQLTQEEKGKDFGTDVFYEIYDIGQDTLFQINDRRELLLQELEEVKNVLSKSDGIAQEAYKVLKYVLFTIKSIHLLSEGEHPTTLLSYLNQNIDELFPQSGNVKPALLIMDVISRSMISIDQTKNTVWLKSSAFKNLKNSAQLRDFYFGLIYQEIRQSLRRERSVLEEELNSIVHDEIIASEIGEKASYDILESPFVAISLLEQYRTSPIPEMIFSDRQLTSIFSDSEIEDLRNRTIPIYEEMKSLNQEANESIDYYDAEEILMQNIDSLADSPEMEASLAQRFVKFQEKYPEVSWDEFRRNNRYIGINIAEIYTTPAEAIDSLYGYFDGDYETVGTFSIAKRDSVIELSKRMLTDYWKGGIPFESQLTTEIYNAGFDYMKANFLWFYYDNRDLVLRDSIRNIFMDSFVAAAKRDSVNLITEAMGLNKPIQKLNIQLQRIDNSQLFIDSLLLRNKRNFGDIVNGFIQFANRMDYIHSELTRLKEQGNANIGTQEFVFLMRNSLDALQQVYEIALPNDHATLNTVKGLTTNLLDAYAAVLEKDFDAIVMNVIPVADSLLELSYRQKVRELKSKTDSLPQSDIILATLTNPKNLTKAQKKQLKKAFKKPISNLKKNEWELRLDTLLEEKENKIRKMHEIFKYGAFLAAVVESKDGEEIKRAIQAVSLPAGSYSIKRRTFRNISLNAYPGLTGGLELASNADNNSWAPNFGFTAPIGLGISWGYRTKINGFKYYTNHTYRRRVEKSTITGRNRFLCGHSGTIYLPLIDLGALVLFRLDNTQEALPEEVGFQQVFSPGIMYGHGLPNVPITLMAGMQVSPQLRSIDDQKANSFRFNASIVVDLPMANFYTKTKWK